MDACESYSVTRDYDLSASEASWSSGVSEFELGRRWLVDGVAGECMCMQVSMQWLHPFTVHCSVTHVGTWCSSEHVFMEMFHALSS